MTDNEQPFPKSISFVYSLLLKSFLKDDYLHLQLIDLVAKEDDLFVFGVGVHSIKPFQASFAGSSRESGRQDG